VWCAIGKLCGAGFVQKVGRGRYAPTEKALRWLERTEPLDQSLRATLQNTEKQVETLARSILVYTAANPPIIPGGDSPLFKKYFQPDGRRLVNELHDVIRGRYLADILVGKGNEGRDILWIGTFGLAPVIDNEEIVVEQLRFDDC
jgi:hypothetical protein